MAGAGYGFASHRIASHRIASHRIVAAYYVVLTIAELVSDE
jgi:hypothetical protein